MAPKIGNKTNLSVTGDDTHKCLILIMAILSGRDYNYFAGGFDVIGTNDSNRSKIKVKLSVVVPSGGRQKAAEMIRDSLQQDNYSVDFGDKYKWVNVYLGDFESDKSRIKIQLKEESVPKTYDKPSGENKGSGGGSANTAIVESAQCLYCDLAFNVYGSKIDEDSLISKDHFEQAFKNIEVDAKLEEMLSMATAWKTSSIRGANALYDTLHSKGTFKFYRNKGVDVLINKAYNNIKKDTVVAGSESIKDKVPASEDKWNPADIWIASTSFDSKKITEKSQTKKVLTFNKFLVDEFNNNNLIGVSLKKITGQAHIEPMNKTSDRKIDTVGYGGASFSYDSLDTYIDFKSGSNTSIQFRNFSGSKGSWQGEVGIKGSSAKHGKIGGGAIWEVLKSHNISYPSEIDNNTQLYTNCGNGQKRMKIAEDIYELLKKIPANDRKIKTGNSEKPQEISDIVNIKDSQRWMYSKFLGLTLINAIKTATNSDEIVQDIYLYASSQHSLSGVYYKLT